MRSTTCVPFAGHYEDLLCGDEQIKAAQTIGKVLQQQLTPGRDTGLTTQRRGDMHLVLEGSEADKRCTSSDANEVQLCGFCGNFEQCHLLANVNHWKRPHVSLMATGQL